MFFVPGSGLGFNVALSKNQEPGTKNFFLPFSHQVGQGHRTHDVSESVLVSLCLFFNRLEVVQVVHGEDAAKRVRTQVFDESSQKLVAVLEQ